MYNIDWDFVKHGQGVRQVDNLIEILHKYRFYLQDKQAYKNRLDYLATFCKVVMSVDSTPYGIFFPEQRILPLFFGKNNGRIIKSVEKANHRYYLDEQGRVHATEFLNCGEVWNVRFYYYFEDSVEIVKYNVLSEKVDEVAQIRYLSSYSFSYTYGYLGYKQQEATVGITYLKEAIVKETADEVFVTILKTAMDLETGKICLFEDTQVLSRDEAYPPKTSRKKSDILSNISFEDQLYNNVKSVITAWNEQDIYAISFFVNSNESNCYGNYCNLSEFYISYNTETDCQYAGQHDEQRWNYAFWRQNETPIIDMNNTNGMIDMLLKWYKKNSIVRIGEESDDCYDTNREYVGRGPNGHYELLMLVANVAKRLQDEGIIKEKFGEDIPIIIHGLEYAWYDIEATKIANPQGQAEDFLITMENF